MAANLWRGFQLRHLISLQAVAEAGSFGRAAERLGYTQSAVSQQIAALEKLVGERLVKRSRGQAGVALTEAGELLLGHADAVVARLQAAYADFGPFAEGHLGVLRVGTYQSVNLRLLPTLMREFAAAWPGTEVRLTDVIGHDLLQMLERGELDLSFETLPLDEGPFEALELLRDQYMLLVAANSELGRRDQPPSLDELASLPWVTYCDKRSCAPLEELLYGLGPEPRVIFRSDDIGAVHGMVGAGVGVALVPALAVDLRDRTVAALPLGATLAPRVLGLAWHRHRYRSPAARAFVGLAARLCRQLAAEGGVPRGVVLSATRL